MATGAKRVLSAIALLVTLAAARAETPAPVPYEGLSFDDVQHRRWYARFWTGRCTDLSLFVCFSGRPYWHETMRALGESAAPDRREALTRRLMALGRRIGHEGARDNDVRKISTDDIRRWYRELEKGGDVTATIARIEAEAERLLAGR